MIELSTGSILSHKNHFNHKLAKSSFLYRGGDSKTEYFINISVYMHACMSWIRIESELIQVLLQFYCILRFYYSFIAFKILFCIYYNLSYPFICSFDKKPIEVSWCAYRSDSDVWKEFVSKPCLSYALRILTGLCVKHTKTIVSGF